MIAEISCGVFATVDVYSGSVVLAYHFIRYAFDLVLNLVACFAHEPLDRENGAFGVGDGLTFGRIAHLAFAAFDESYDRGVVRAPSLLVITTGSLPSITETHELVVPKSIPIIFPIMFIFF